MTLEAESVSAIEGAAVRDLQLADLLPASDLNLNDDDMSRLEKASHPFTFANPA